MELKSVREIVKARDGIGEAEVDDMVEKYRHGCDDGEDPEELIQDIFGLEPDYIFDPELNAFGGTD